MMVLARKEAKISRSNKGKYELNGSIQETNENETAIDLSSKRITLTWENINVYLAKDKSNLMKKNLPCFRKDLQKNHIIQDVSGIAKPGQILAILGTSGAGKSTLLNSLNFRNRGSLKVKGDVKVNGQLVNSPIVLASISGYVQQENLFFGSLRVKEHLVFQAMLRMESRLTKKEKLQRVDEVLHDLNLKKCENTIIGMPEKGLKGISGGQKRRLAFASEIITNPNLLFCDEPTSGLDSFMAYSVVESMRKLANQGKTIICTIHQPSSEIFQMFDRICLLTEGKLAFLGELNQAHEFFSSEGYLCPNNFNPADFYIRKLAIKPKEKESTMKNLNKICDSFKSSEYNELIKKEIEAEKEESFNLNSPKYTKLAFKTNVFNQTRWLIHRNIINIARDPFTFRIQIFQSLFIGLIYGLIYFKLEISQQGIQNINGLLFLFLTSSSFSYIFQAVSVFPTERAIFMREHQNGLYKVISYYLSKIIIDIPKYTFLPLLFISICYWMTDLNTDVSKFFMCVLINILVAQSSVAFGEFISAASPSENAAYSFAGPALVPFMIFGGFFLNNASIPDYFIWLKYISFFNYANEMLIINQWENIREIPCQFNMTRCFMNGDDVIQSFEMKKENFYPNLGYILAIILAWRVCTFFVLLIKSKRK